MEDHFSMDGMGGGGEWFQDDSSTVHVLCTLFQLLLHQPHLRSGGIISWRLRIPAVAWWKDEQLGNPPIPGGKGFSPTHPCGTHHCWVHTPLWGFLCPKGCIQPRHRLHVQGRWAPRRAAPTKTSVTYRDNYSYSLYWLPFLLILFLIPYRAPRDPLLHGQFALKYFFQGLLPWAKAPWLISLFCLRAVVGAQACHSDHWNLSILPRKSEII